MRVATLNKVNDGIFASVRSLPLNATTNVRVQAIGNEVFLFFNNSFDSMRTVPSRISGAATLFAPNPWSTAALATIGSIQMKEAFKTLYIASSAFNGHLSKSAVKENSYVPPNFALSFDIKPSKKSLLMLMTMKKWMSRLKITTSTTNSAQDATFPPPRGTKFS